jgi:hypothetical protein
MIKIDFTRPFHLYVLKLIQDKYYVGITWKNILERFSQHNKGKGAEWTKLYKPICIIESIKTNNIFEEDKYTKMYMNKFGIENVRGGSYSKINLEEYQIKAIEQELKSVNHLCFKCGKFGHFACNCNVFK